MCVRVRVRVLSLFHPWSKFRTGWGFYFNLLWAYFVPICTENRSAYIELHTLNEMVTLHIDEK